MAAAQFPHEITLVPRNFLEYKYAKLLRYTDMPRGGHFAAFEEPELLAEDILAFASQVLTL